MPSDDHHIDIDDIVTATQDWEEARLLVEAEIRAIWDDILGTRLNLDGSAGSGTDIPIANVDVKAVRTGPPGALLKCDCEVASV